MKPPIQSRIPQRVARAVPFPCFLLNSVSLQSEGLVACPAMRLPGLFILMAAAFAVLAPAGLAEAQTPGANGGPGVRPLEESEFEAIRLQKILTAVRIDERITLDGRFDEPAWQRATPGSDFYQRIIAEAQVSPPPKAARSIVSPSFIRPSLRASSIAIGIDAALVFATFMTLR